MLKPMQGVKHAPVPDGWRLVEDCEEQPHPQAKVSGGGDDWLDRGSYTGRLYSPHYRYIVPIEPAKETAKSLPNPKIKYGPIPDGWRLVEDHSEKPHPSAKVCKTNGLEWTDRTAFWVGQPYLTDSRYIVPIEPAKPYGPIPDGWRLVENYRESPHPDAKVFCHGALWEHRGEYKNERYLDGNYYIVPIDNPAPSSGSLFNAEVKRLATICSERPSKHGDDWNLSWSKLASLVESEGYSYLAKAIRPMNASWVNDLSKDSSTERISKLNKSAMNPNYSWNNGDKGTVSLSEEKASTSPSVEVAKENVEEKDMSVNYGKPPFADAMNEMALASALKKISGDFSKPMHLDGSYAMGCCPDKPGIIRRAADYAFFSTLRRLKNPANILIQATLFAAIVAGGAFGLYKAGKVVKNNLPAVEINWEESSPSDVAAE